MKLSSYLEPELIFYNIPGRNIESLFLNFVDKIKKSDKNFAKASASIVESISNRGDLTENYVGNGLFLPRLRSENYDDVLVAIGLPKEDIEINGEPLKLIVLVVVPCAQNTLLLSLLASISYISESDDNIEKISNITHPMDLIAYIRKKEKNISEQLKAKDMLTFVEPISVEDSLENVTSRIARDNCLAIPVVKGNSFVGEISSWELIGLGMPSITNVLSNVGFLRNSEPFEDYFKAEKNVKVGDIYQKKVAVVYKQASIMEVALIMLRKRVSRVYVLDKQKYLGTISKEDIVKKVLHL